MKKIFFFFMVFMLLMGCGDTTQGKVENTQPLHFYQEEENGKLIEYDLSMDYVESINNPVSIKTNSLPYVNKQCKVHMLVLTNIRQLDIPMELKCSGELYQVDVNYLTLVFYAGNGFKKDEKGLKITFMFEDNGQNYYFTEPFPNLN